MKPNVFLTTRERGKLVARREVHNVWLDSGRDYLRQMMVLQSFDPDTPLLNSRPKHLQFGIGGDRQAPTVSSALEAAYPVGFDPEGTTGRQYTHQFPYTPAITTLERPVRRTGGATAYPGAPGDVWYTDAALPKLRVTNPTLSSCALNYRVNLGGGDFVYGSFTSIPLSEMGILATPTIVAATPFLPIWAYVNFDPVPLSSALELEVIWVISF